MQVGGRGGVPGDLLVGSSFRQRKESHASAHLQGACLWDPGSRALPCTQHSLVVSKDPRVSFQGSIGLQGQGEPSTGRWTLGAHTMAGEAQVVETLGVLKGAGLTQCGHEPAVVILRGHAGPQL